MHLRTYVYQRMYHIMSHPGNGLTLMHHFDLVLHKRSIILLSFWTFFKPTHGPQDLSNHALRRTNGTETTSEMMSMIESYKLPKLIQTSRVSGLAIL